MERRCTEFMHHVRQSLKDKMPLFSRSTFRTPKKPPRRNKSLPNIAQLDDSLNFTTESIKLDAEAHATGESFATQAQPSLVMKLGDCALSFEDGKWVTGQYYVRRTREPQN